MKKELQDKLYEKYPKIFRQKDLPMTETCLCWGLECGSGWYTLIDKLCGYLQFHIDHNKHPQIETVQVKEKFGTLRFYTDGADDFQNGAIGFAESMSAEICEDCGSTDNVTRTTGWIMTKCAKCLAEYDEHMKKNNEKISNNIK